MEVIFNLHKFDMSEIYDKTYKLYADRRDLFGIVFEVTSTCNWRCRHCYMPEYENKGPSITEIEDVFKQLRELGVFELTLTGGEIFTRKDMIEIIKLARKYYFKVILFSNISLLSEEMISILSDVGVSEISCTVFSLDKHIHDYITQREGSLERTLKNAKLIKRYGIPLTVKTIITNLNYHEWVNVYEYCRDNGYGFMLDHDIFAKKNGEQNPVELRLTKSQLMMEISNLDKFRGFKYRKHSENEFVCGGIQNSLFIDHELKVFPCNKFLYFLGDLHNESIDSIWKSAEMSRIQNMKWKDLGECKKCSKSDYCIHCPGTAWLENGSEYGKSTMACEKAKIREMISRDEKICI